MYAEFYGLTKNPFNMTPDPEFLLMTKQHREGLAGLSYAILERRGFLMLTGAAGSGKTTLLAWLLEKLPPTRVTTSVILNPTLTRDEFFELVLLNFGVTEIPPSKAQRLQILYKLLAKGKEEGRVLVLIVDEAHKLNAELLEEVRLLGNFESAQHKLLQILLIGQAELDDTLNRPDLWQLKQRIAVRLALHALPAGEVEEYIRHRWKIAGCATPPPFTADAIAAVTELSRGIPRLVNSICDNALVLAFAEDAKMVTAARIETAAADLARGRIATPPATNNRTPPPQPAVIRIETPMLKTLEGYCPKAKKSVMSRWAIRLGMA
jgi:general secretion pathway protein A